MDHNQERRKMGRGASVLTVFLEEFNESGIRCQGVDVVQQALQHRHTQQRLKIVDGREEVLRVPLHHAALGHSQALVSSLVVTSSCNNEGVGEPAGINRSAAARWPHDNGVVVNCSAHGKTPA